MSRILSARYVATLVISEEVVVDDVVYDGPNKRDAMRACKRAVKANDYPSTGNVKTAEGALLLQGHRDEAGRFIVEEL